MTLRWKDIDFNKNFISKIQVKTRNRNTIPLSEPLIRILFNEEMYYLAYQRIYAKPGNMTQGADGETIDRISLPRIEKLILSLKDESYSPQPSRRVHIPKKNGKT